MVGPLDAVKPLVGTGRPGGRPTNIGLDQYCTSYRQSYSKELFQSCLGHHFGTGYSANHRPVLYYSSSLDRYDNPQFGLSLLDSFESQTKRHYQRLVLPDGTEPLACSGSRRRESGYLQLQTQPRPRAASCQTEYKGTYIPHRLRVLGVSDQCVFVLVGPIEDSGYTKEANLQLNTFLTQNINMDDARRTQESVMRTDFLPGCFLQVVSLFLSFSAITLSINISTIFKMCVSWMRSVAFTRETQRPLTSSAFLQDGVSEDSGQKTRTAAARWSIGPMGSSGFVLNAPNITSLSHTPADPQHFLTHYQSKFCDKSSVVQQRSEWVRGGIQRQRECGYSGRDTDRFNLSGFNVLASQ
ncbi:protein phosphatase 1 regulatory subunit 32-like [Sinocyclocheilus anshuiensis]|uniref:protein phosphatase 1 regulatory subunit 32-like n=1 Tax=Sinocyclocheilus anshuiensis TaxID=1608454 RepID=UPI0007B84667|nr:PREDICTED: protein phosphatase 1 regulatory subunit 32-like [Sinocyclocheilus anshuiensis]